LEEQPEVKSEGEQEEELEEMQPEAGVFEEHTQGFDCTFDTFCLEEFDIVEDIPK